MERGVKELSKYRFDCRSRVQMNPVWKEGPLSDFKK